MIGRLLFVFALCLAFGLKPAAATQTRLPIDLEWLVGKWEGGGIHGGRKSKASLEAAIVLGSQYVELSYRADIDVPNLRTFEGRAFYWPLDGSNWKGHWFDSWSNRLPITAVVEGTVLTADWGTAGTERGRTIYRLLADGRLEIVDYDLGEDGSHRLFARQTLLRQR
jgi:hypothetical protein